MNNHRESEIRKESLDIVVETYRVANLLKSCTKPKFRTQLVDSAFLVSSSIAKAFILLQNEKIEEEIGLALKGINKIRKSLVRIEKKSLLNVSDIRPLKALLDSSLDELEALLAASQIRNIDAPSPKLEKACI
jgi:dsDNA-specific endonuclease/ATPase MutS2